MTAPPPADELQRRQRPHAAPLLLLAAVLLVLAAAPSAVVAEAAAAACAAVGPGPVSVSGGATSLASPATWSASTTVSSTSASAVWNLQWQATAAITLAAGSQASLSCLTVANVSLVPPSAASFGQPAAFLVSAPLAGQAAPVLMDQVRLLTDCATVRQYQLYYVELNKMQLSGAMEMSSPFWLYVYWWQSPNVVMTSVNITCMPSSSLKSGATSLPGLATMVPDAASLLDAVDRLQRLQGPVGQQPLPIILVVDQSIQFTKDIVAPHWPRGMDITGNVTIAAEGARQVVFDWSSLVNVFNIRAGVQTFLTLSGFIMVNLPVSYTTPVYELPYHFFGLIQTAQLSIHRTPPTAVTFQSCTNVISSDTFSYWAFWFSLASSPSPTIAALASWTNFKRVELTTSLENRVRLADTNVAFVNLLNHTLASPDFYPVTFNHTGILDITKDETGQKYVPAVSYFMVKALVDMQFAVNMTIGNVWTKQFGQYIVMCSNISGDTPASASNSTVFPVPRYAAALPGRTPPPAYPSGSAAALTASAVAASALPPAPPPPQAQPLLQFNLALPAVLQVATTIIAWPQALVCWDLRQAQPLMSVSSVGTLDVRGMSLFNLPLSLTVNASTADPLERLVSGLWSFPQTSSGSTDFVLSLVNVTLYVPPTELHLYYSSASLLNFASKAAMPQTLGVSGQALMARWITLQQVSAVGPTWIYYDLLQTTRFQGASVNVTSSVPPACSDFAILPVYVNYAAFTSSAAPSRSASSLPSWAIGLITGLGGAMLLAAVAAAAAVVVVVRRRRRRRRSHQVALSTASSTLLVGTPSKLQTHLTRSGELLAHSLAGSEAPSGSGHHLGKVQNGSSSLRTAPPSASGSSGPVPSCSILVDSDRSSGAATVRAASATVVNRLAKSSMHMEEDQVQFFGVLGRGGNGIVYKGVWKGLAVAAKVMVVHEERHEEAQRQMLEAMISTSLSHPNIVTTYKYDLKRLTTNNNSSSLAAFKTSLSLPDVSHMAGGAPHLGSVQFAGASAWQLLILQELCSGGTLRQMIDNAAASSVNGVYIPHLEHVLLLSLDVALGLEHLHSKNVVHSDMTPNNVLLQAAVEPRPGGLRWTAKVADFGLSVAFEEGHSHVSHMFAGTPYYIAPETQSSGIVSKASDLFAFGILLYEMFSGPVSARAKAVAAAAPRSATVASPSLSPSSGTPAHSSAGGGTLTAAPSAAELQTTGGGTSGTGDSQRALSAERSSDAEVMAEAASLMPLLSGSACILPSPRNSKSSGGAPASARVRPPRTPTHTCTPLLGGGGGKFGAARALPPLPPSCPHQYASLVEECLSPVFQTRPTIGAVCVRLRAMLSEGVALNVYNDSEDEAEG